MSVTTTLSLLLLLYMVALDGVADLDGSIVFASWSLRVFIVVGRVELSRQVRIESAVVVVVVKAREK